MRKHYGWLARTLALALLLLTGAMLSVTVSRLSAGTTFGTQCWQDFCIPGVGCFKLNCGCQGPAFNCAEVVETDDS